MRHSNSKRKFGRVRKVRTALLNSLALALITKDKIKTTEAKAKELHPFVEKLVSQGRLGTLASRRELISKVGLVGASKIIRDISPKYKDRSGGYTRVIKLPQRLSDGSFMAVVEFV